MTLSSVATFDVLFLSSRADPELGLSLAELHILDYLACLMSIYDGQDVARWGYQFSVADYGAPSSSTLSDAVTYCMRATWLERDDRIYRLTGAGRDEVSFQARLPTNSRRIRYLSGSASAALTMSLPSLADAITNEPGLARALRFLRRKQLLDEVGLEQVVSQFEDLRQAIGSGMDRQDLMVPTVVWLSFLASNRQGPPVAA